MPSSEIIRIWLPSLLVAFAMIMLARESLLV